MITVKSDTRASVGVTLGRDNTVFLNPYNGEILGASRRLTIFCAILSTGTAGLASKAKAAPRCARSTREKLSASPSRPSPALLLLAAVFSPGPVWQWRGDAFVPGVASLKDLSLHQFYPS